MPYSKNKKYNNHNKTKKNLCKPSMKTLQKFCNVHANTYSAFEEEYEKMHTANSSRPNTDIEKELITMFKIPFTPGHITPRDDYYTYINYQWLEKQHKKLQQEQKYYVQVDSFRVTQEKVYYELMDIVKEYVSKNASSKKGKAIKAVYNSLYNLNPKPAEEYITWITNAIEQIIERGNLYELLGSINTNEIISWGCPIVWSVMKDEKQSTVYRSIVSAPQLTVYDYEIYIEDAYDTREKKTYKKEFKKKYLNFIDEMFSAICGKNNPYKSEYVWECEYDILTALGCNDIKNDDISGYNMMNNSSANIECNFNWNEFVRHVGYKRPPSKFICSSKNYIKCILEKLNENDAWKSIKWKTYFLYISYRQVMRFHDEWRLIYYNFHGKYVAGQPVPWPREIFPVVGLSLCFNTFLTNEYIERNKKQQHIDYVKNMAKDLLTVYKRIIKRNTWLSPSTKRYALKKLETIHLEIGSPKLMREDPILDYNDDGAYQNLKKVALWRTKKLIELDGKSTNVDIPVIDWQEFKMIGKQSYIVNAYYTPTENSIYVPLAYLQPPFIDLQERGIEYNLAHIGLTLGHEMSHCLDDMGSKYDHNGNLHNWWTPSDRKKFNLKVKDVVAQYETFARYDGIEMDATLSTGENLADISGFAICEEYLRDFQEKNDDIVPIRAVSFHAFFIYLAVQARQKIFDAAIPAQLKTNPHPLDKYRTNCPLSRLELFRSLYNIKKGDKMFWKTTDTIW
jgi:putative endopeptidase